MVYEVYILYIYVDRNMESHLWWNKMKIWIFECKSMSEVCVEITQEKFEAYIVLSMSLEGNSKFSWFELDFYVNYI